MLFARWLSISPRVLMVDEPTRGVDVGTKARIHLALRALSDRGGAVLVASSEIPEVLGLSDRIYVMATGRIVDEITAAEANADRLLESASQLSTRRAGGAVLACANSMQILLSESCRLVPEFCES